MAVRKSQDPEKHLEPLKMTEEIEGAWKKIKNDYHSGRIIDFIKEYRKKSDGMCNNEMLRLKKLDDLGQRLYPKKFKATGTTLTSWFTSKVTYEEGYDISPIIKLLDLHTLTEETRYQNLIDKVKACEITSNKSSKYIEDPMQIIGGRGTGTSVLTYNPETFLDIEMTGHKEIKKLVFNGIAPIQKGMEISVEIDTGIGLDKVWKLKRFSNEPSYPTGFKEEYKKRSLPIMKFNATQYVPKIHIPELDITYLP